MLKPVINGKMNLSEIMHVGINTKQASVEHRTKIVKTITKTSFEYFNILSVGLKIMKLHRQNVQRQAYRQH